VIHIPAIDSDGTPTFPEYWNLKELEQAKIDAGSIRDFELVYQGRVLPDEGAIFKSEYWRYWKNGVAPWQYHIEHPEYIPIQLVVQSWDTAHKEKQENDFSVCTTWGVTKNGYYLLDMYRAKVDFPKLTTAFKLNASKWNPNIILVEDASSGTALIQEMKAKTRLPIIEVRVDRSKLARANAVTPILASGNVFIPEDSMYRTVLEHECEIFPSGEHDDIVDSITQFLNWIRNNQPRYDDGEMPIGIPTVSKWR
jgi:predicted phage terminase large subunit-like protein